MSCEFVSGQHVTLQRCCECPSRVYDICVWFVCVYGLKRKRSVSHYGLVCPVGKIACQSLQSGIIFLWECGEHATKVPTSYGTRTYIDWYSENIQRGIWSPYGIYLWNITVVSHLTSCSFVDRCKHFGATCVPTLGLKIKIEASCLFENLAPVYRTTRRHIPEVRTRLSFYFKTLP